MGITVWFNESGLGLWITGWVIHDAVEPHDVLLVTTRGEMYTEGLMIIQMGFAQLAVLVLHWSHPISNIVQLLKVLIDETGIDR